MTDNKKGESLKLIDVFRLEEKSGLFTLGKKFKKPEEIENTDIIYIKRKIKQKEEIKIIKDIDEISNTGNISAVRIYKKPVPLVLTFSEVVTGNNQCDWDAIFKGHLVVTDKKKFLTAYDLKYLVSGVSISKEMINYWIENYVNHRVRDIIGDYSIQDLQYNSKLPLPWWQKQFEDWLSELGLRIKIYDLVWKSARYENLEAEKERKNALENQIKKQKEQYRAEIAKLKNKVEYERKKEEIKKDQQLSSMERKKQILAARQETEKVKRKAEKSEKKYNEKIEKLDNKLKNMKIDPQQTFLQMIKDKIAEDGQRVVLEKKELLSRDIRAKKIDYLAINSSLQFKLSAEKAGYITLINIGTSGSIGLHIPNAYVSSKKAKILANRTYSVPGQELLPDDRLKMNGLDYVEAGPAGWEQLILLISEVPLINDSKLRTTSRSIPFAQLSRSEIKEIQEKLKSMPDSSWTAGHLSFMVEDKQNIEAAATGAKKKHDKDVDLDHNQNISPSNDNYPQKDNNIFGKDCSGEYIKKSFELSEGNKSFILPSCNENDNLYIILYSCDDIGAKHKIEFEVYDEDNPKTSYKLRARSVNYKSKPAENSCWTSSSVIREIEEESLKKHSQASLTARSIRKKTIAEVGDKEEFYINVEKEKRLATLKAKNNNVLIWVTEESERNLTESDINFYRDEFRDIYRKIKNYFGKEPNADNFNVLRNTCNRINIVFSSFKPTGYFFTADLYSNHKVQVNSNERKIIYINSNMPRNFTAGLIAHEFQHMLFYNEKVLAKRNSDDIWLNEGLSELARDIAGYGYEQGLGKTDTKSYLNCTWSTSLLNWEQKAGNYGNSYLFVRYLYDRFGKDIIKNIIKAKECPRKEIKAQTGIDFNKLFEDWAVTMLAQSVRLEVSPKYYYPTIPLSGLVSKKIKPGEKINNWFINGWGIGYVQIKGKGGKLKININDTTKSGKFRELIILRINERS